MFSFPRWHPRALIAAAFALSGFVFASWAVRVPDLSHQVGASHSTLGLALLCVSLGALVTMRPTGALCERYGAGRVTAAAAALIGLAVVTPGLVHSVSALAAVLVAFGASTGMLNVAMNSLGVQLEATTRRPALPLLHAAFSFGALSGSLSGGLAAASLSPAAHLVLVGALALVAATSMRSALGRLDEPAVWSDAPAAHAADDPHDADRRPVRSRWTVVTLGAIAGCTAYGEGALTDWGALHLTETLGASAFTAAAGFAGFSLAMALGRLAGHRLQVSLGSTALLVGGALVAAIGMVMASLSTTLAVTLVGFVVVGLGFSNVFPVAIGRAGALAGPRGVGLASTVGYGGLLVGPALIGLLASGVGLPVALSTVSVLAAVAAALAVAVHDPAETPARVAAWSTGQSYAEVSARLRLSLRAAADRHVEALSPLSPATAGAGPADPPPAAPGADPRWVDLESLFGATR